jgi:hypothetical protein
LSSGLVLAVDLYMLEGRFGKGQFGLRLNLPQWKRSRKWYQEQEGRRRDQRR